MSAFPPMEQELELELEAEDGETEAEKGRPLESFSAGGGDSRQQRMG